MNKTALNAKHRAHGARLVEFGGWEMPVHYEGIIVEHNHVREGVGLFDLQHMGRLRLTGPDRARARPLPHQRRPPDPARPRPLRGDL